MGDDFVFRVRPDMLWVRRFPSFAEYSAGGWSGVSVFWDFFEVADGKWAGAAFHSHAPCRNAQHATVMASRLLMSGAPVRYLDAMIAVPGKWQRWPCEEPAVIIRLVERFGNLSAYDPSSSEFADLLGLSEADTQRRVELWHARPMCG